MMNLKETYHCSIGPKNHMSSSIASTQSVPRSPEGGRLSQSKPLNSDMRRTTGNASESSSEDETSMTAVHGLMHQDDTSDTYHRYRFNTLLYITLPILFRKASQAIMKY